MKKILYSFMCIILVATLFAGCGKKKMEDNASSMESKVSNIASDIASGVSSIGNELMPSSSNTEQ